MTGKKSDHEVVPFLVNGPLTRITLMIKEFLRWKSQNFL